MPTTKPDDAIYCSVKDCRSWSRRWNTGPTAEFICGAHWKRLTRREKAAWARVKRSIRAVGPGWWVNKPLRLRFIRTWAALVRRAALP